jgi:hypothetical protein
MAYTMLLVILLVFLLAVPGFMGTFGLGLLAARRAFQHGGEYGDTLALLALHLCEPLVTCGYMCVLVADAHVARRYQQFSAAQTAFIWTAPMIVHLTPLLGVRMRTALYQVQAVLIGVMGSSRWGLTWLGVYAFQQSAIDSLVGPLLLVGIGVLWLSTFWGAYELLGPLAPPYQRPTAAPARLSPLAGDS